MSAWPLRVKLVALMLVLLTAALVVTGGVSLYSTRSFANQRVEDQLRNSIHGKRDVCQTRQGQDPYGPAQRSAYWVACALNADDPLVQRTFLPSAGDDSQGAPDLPATTVAGLVQGAELTPGNDYLLTVPAKGGVGHDWRIIVSQQPNPITGRQWVVVGLSLDEVDETVSRQLWVTVGVGAGVLVLLAVVAYLLVRSSLRPLVEVEQTAEAIAAGDLTRRVPEADPRTEVGGLSTALNTMLGQIETAFEERRASEEAALASEERMRRFVADASHELRTPLTSIRGFAELQRQSGRADENVGRIEHHATRMGLLVDDLLLLARMDQQRPLEKKPVDLLALATDALIDARVTAHEHKLRLRTQGGDDDDVEPAIVQGDETRLRQVLQNLITNALTHTPAGTEITVFVGTEGRDAVLEVADNGPGMTAEDAERVFERFYRTDPSRTRALGGSGLGLSIVSALVTAHGGKVTLRTAPGEGAAFRVTLPLSD
ncbi:HAMP domain-containing histidine kinase [Dactylosporangium aurantiacum]|uniref:histidine kinase n=1 Tax=Dactylosporangium aurantiacum TaxID=35754 RepID=A0A9Q9MJC1_9ACTN|nr:HAMP domain-containing sensor histidine kinase [Dactylosporangium aurantiacum]MDG6109051.1 HAMP domain-containing sensor histidine kinase [Dactylosporangium aurantiacum]UWZ54551.1 HAMP domain-containing histidine kinase [Dactylosporangium aurantiacum]